MSSVGLYGCWRRLQKLYPELRRTKMFFNNESTPGCWGMLKVDQNFICLRPVANSFPARPIWVLVLLHEVRHVFQVADGLLTRDKYFSDMDYQRRIEFDADFWACERMPIVFPDMKISEIEMASYLSLRSGVLTVTQIDELVKIAGRIVAH